jgi:RHS repeat-associated protein
LFCTINATGLNWALALCHEKDRQGEKTTLLASKNRIIVFAGQYIDDETGLHYNYHRYYDPTTGRYLTPDPIGLAGRSIFMRMQA